MLIWEKVLFKGHSDFSGEIKVVENSGSRKLVVAGYTQSQSVRFDGSVGYPLWENLIPPQINLNQNSRVLLLGLGAGTVAKLITKKFGSEVTIDGVEIDPLIVDLGKKFFAMNEANLNIILADAAKYVKDARYKYDFICVDTFKGKEIPKPIETKEFFQSVKNLLKKDGWVSINKIFSGETEQKNFEELISSVFSAVDTTFLRSTTRLDNMIIYAKY